jgi:hypothetical protein
MILGVVLTVSEFLGLTGEAVFESKQHCGTPNAYPVCADIPAQYLQIYGLIVIGIAFVVVGGFLVYKFRVAPRVQPS